MVSHPTSAPFESEHQSLWQRPTSNFLDEERKWWLRLAMGLPIRRPTVYIIQWSVRCYRATHSTPWDDAINKSIRAWLILFLARFSFQFVVDILAKISISTVGIDSMVIEDIYHHRIVVRICVSYFYCVWYGVLCITMLHLCVPCLLLMQVFFLSVIDVASSG